MKIAVTGANGYIGQCFLKLASGSENEIVAFSRVRPYKYCTDWFFYDLTVDTPPVLPSDIDVVLHLATSKNPDNLQITEQELLAVDLLIEASKKVVAKYIFVSSQTARSDAPTSYGRTKWHIEQKVLSEGGWVVRPGQVYGGELLGLFGMLVDTVKRLPILPAFIPAPKVQPIHVVDLSMGLLHIAVRSDVPSGVYCLATPIPVKFSKFLGEIAKSRLRCSRIFVPIPVIAINALGNSLRTKLGLERLRSLFELPIMDTTDDLKKLDLVLRPLASGMNKTGNDRRRNLLREGKVLLTYVLKVRPNYVLLIRYVRAVENLRDGQSIGLPAFFLRCPTLISLIEPYSWIDKVLGAEFLWRLDAATMLAEATPFGATRFLGFGAKQGLLSSLILMTNAVLNEIFWRILRIITLPIIRLSLSRAVVV